MNNIRLGEREVIETQDVTITLSFKNGEPLNEITRVIQEEIDRQDLAADAEAQEDIEAYAKKEVPKEESDLSDIVINRG